jgi:hypothetical protein
MALDKRHILLDGASGPGCHRAVLPAPLGTEDWHLSRILPRW